MEQSPTGDGRRPEGRGNNANALWSGRGGPSQRGAQCRLVCHARSRDDADEIERAEESQPLH